MARPPLAPVELHRQAPARAPSRALLAASALVFAGSAAATVAGCASMPGMDMPMPGGWTMSMTWMRMPGQTWTGAAASFLGMWTVMMVAMMLPSLVPMLLRFQGATGGPTAVGAGLRTVLAGAGYFAVWAAWGVVVFPLGVALAAAEMRHPPLAQAVPAASGAIVLLAGALQLTPWKARALACCREHGSGRTLAANAPTALRHGVRLGLRCSRCCSGPTLALLALGVMDLGAMAAVTVAITAERLAPAGARVARATGAIAVVAGAGLIVRAAWLR